jgi:uncharacterized phiE125 gp8 family phage protein
MNLILITAPTEEPVTLQEARLQLRDPPTELNASIVKLIYSAREWCEDFTGRALITQTWELVLSEFVECIQLPLPPLQSVVSVKYRDTANVEQTLSSSAYEVAKDEYGARLTLATGSSWPATYERVDAVRVRFTAGYGGAALVPNALQAACLLHIEAHFDRDERMMEKLLVAAESLAARRAVVSF